MDEARAASHKVQRQVEEQQREIKSAEVTNTKANNLVRDGEKEIQKFKDRLASLQRESAKHKKDREKLLADVRRGAESDACPLRSC